MSEPGDCARCEDDIRDKQARVHTVPDVEGLVCTDCVDQNTTVTHEANVRYGDAWHIDGFASAWWDATHAYLEAGRNTQDKFRNSLHVTVTIKVEEYGVDRVSECEMKGGGTVTEHPCSECRACVIRKETVSDVLFFECPDCGWVTTEVLRSQ